MTLQGKIAVVTGANKGIGKSIAMALANQGCNLAITARNEDDLRRTEQEIAKTGVKVLSVAADIRKSDDVAKIVKTIQSQLGTASILINNAGIGKFSEVSEMTDEDFQSILETNLFGVFYCTRGFLPGMIENKNGHIINIGSLAGKNTFVGGSAYCASKSALIAFGECLMLEVRHHNIKVTTICPGTVQTEFGARGHRDKTWALTSEDVAGAVLAVLNTSEGSLISMVDLRPLIPPQKR